MANEELIRLLTLAKSKDASSRKRLVENITDLFLTDDGRLSEHERALMSDILGKLIVQVETDIRKELAETLVSKGVNMPEIAALLAKDEIEIARPLLEKSDLLRDPDLIEVVRMRTDEHRMAITMRESISEQVSDALIEYGSEDVIEALLSNHDSAINKRAMEYLVAESRRVDRFQEPLVMRADLPADLAYRMYWWVSAALRKRIIEDFDIDPVVVEQAIKRAAQTVIIDQETGDGAYVRAQKLVRRLYENGELSVNFLTSSLRQQKVAVFVAGLAQLSGLDFKTAWRIFSDNGGESFAILAKAIGVDRSQFTTIYLLVTQAREGGQIKSPGVLRKILDLFDKITEDNARGALMIWQRDSAYQVAVDEFERTA